MGTTQRGGRELRNQETEDIIRLPNWYEVDESEATIEIPSWLSLGYLENRKLLRRQNAHRCLFKRELKNQETEDIIRLPNWHEVDESKTMIEIPSYFRLDQR
mmetsp:Transcript_8300/g.10497  ORF Transcript_8300/g.10497 Transcript_8300/m.10497 type:complete len:102 (-) Transcript_8300:204-509(-)